MSTMARNCVILATLFVVASTTPKHPACSEEAMSDCLLTGSEGAEDNQPINCTKGLLAVQCVTTVVQRCHDEVEKEKMMKFIGQLKKNLIKKDPGCRDDILDNEACEKAIASCYALVSRNSTEELCQKGPLCLDNIVARCKKGQTHEHVSAFVRQERQSITDNCYNSRNSANSRKISLLAVVCVVIVLFCLCLTSSMISFRSTTG